jgi:hypothetical protein
VVDAGDEEMRPGRVQNEGERGKEGMEFYHLTNND